MKALQEHTPADLQTTGPNPAPASVDLVPVLVGQVYEEAPPVVRGRLIEHLLKPLSVLSLVAVANGAFARITLGNATPGLHVSAEDAQRIASADVIALVNHVQQVSVQVVDGLSQIISSSPVLAGSTATAMLLTLLAKRAIQHAPITGNDFDPTT
ncbi:MAG: hypothetical protein KGN32_07690 [Burkholderiales bacterium]|nr:hypothetical protein [Burkholderiales bacterium]